METLGNLHKEPDVSIGDEKYRVCPLELRIKYCGPGHGWKILRKFETLEELAAYWKDLTAPSRFKGSAGKEIVVRECMEANAVLPPEAEAAPAPGAMALAMPGIGCTELGANMDSACAGRILAEQYRRAMDGLRECIRFGAMLAELENSINRSLSRQTTGMIDGREGGIKEWLTANCPEVDYGWALKYKRLAEGVQACCSLPASVPLSAALASGAPPEGAGAGRLAKARREVSEFLAGKTARQLEFAFGLRPAPANGGAREGAGRPRLEPSAETRAAAAWGLLGREIDRATAWHFERFLPEANCREALSTVDLLRDALKARLAEFGKGARDVG